MSQAATDTPRPIADVAEEMRERGHGDFVEQNGPFYLCFNTGEVRSSDGASTTLEPQPEGASNETTAPTIFWVLPLQPDPSVTRVRVGRSEECEVTLTDQSISTEHAVFEIDGDRVRLLDAGSKNGTFVHDVIVAREGSGEATLLEGTRAPLRFGSLSVVFFRLPALIEAARMLGLDPGGD